MSEYTLDSQVSDGADVILGGHKYRLRFPTLGEVEKLQELKTDEERTEAVYKFVEKTKDDQPDFKELLKNSSIKATQEFGNMIRTEFGIED